MKRIAKLVLGDDKRTIKARKNIIASLVIKGFSIIIGFLMVRVTINYLDEVRYGVWITLTSFIAWFTFFEVGLGNGLKNRLAESLAIDDLVKARIYVSTTYAILTIIILVVALIFFFANLFLDWTSILNTDPSLRQDLSYLSLIVFNFFFLRFVLKLISTVLRADQRPAIAGAFGPIGNFISLLLIFLLAKWSNEGSLIYLGWVLSVVPTVVLIAASIFFYSSSYKKISPSFRFIDFSFSRDLVGLGLKFFLIQISGLIIYQSSNIIIAQYLGPYQVTVYSVAYKYLSSILMIFTIIVAPFWAAYTEAWVKKDYEWIKSTVRKLLFIWLGVMLVGFVMLVFSNQFYFFWIGDSVEVPWTLSICLYLYFVSFTFGTIYVTFINGVGKVKLQMYTSLIGSLVFISVSILLFEYTDIGSSGLVLASIISNFNGIILAPIQYKKIISGKGTGLWIE